VRALPIALLATLALGGGIAQSASESTSLTVTVWSQGRPGPAQSWTLGCSPPRGTHPRRGAACTALARAKTPFTPVPENAICTQIYGGPEEAVVRGTFRGRRVSARFERTDGCQITRWGRVGALLPLRSSR
jgi:subtilisin inhibitor-like